VSVIARRFLVTGKVQGVFFRASAAREAQRLGLRGFARNLPGGDVEVLALGSCGEVDELARWLEVGPPRARVQSVAARDEDPRDFSAVTDFRTA
jgi:acylphosphatase